MDEGRGGGGMEVESPLPALIAKIQAAQRRGGLGTFNAVWDLLKYRGWHHFKGRGLVSYYYAMPSVKKKSEGYGLAKVRTKTVVLTTTV